MREDPGDSPELLDGLRAGDARAFEALVAVHLTCHHAREWLSALVDDALDPADRAGVEAHL